MILNMSKSCLHLFFLGMVVVFAAVPALADEFRDDDEPPYVIPYFGEKPWEPFPVRLREPSWRHLLQDVEEESPFAGEKLAPEEAGEKAGRSLEEDVEEESPFAGEKPGRSLEEDVEEESPFAGEKLAPEEAGGKPGRSLGEDVEEESPFTGEKLAPEEAGRSLEEDVEEESPFAGEKPGRSLEEDVEEESPFAGEKPGRSLEELGISPPASVIAKPPTRSPFANMIKPSKGRVFKQSEVRKDGDIFYVEKPRERQPLITRHRKIPTRSLLADHGKEKNVLNVVRRTDKPPHEHKSGYEH